jgi:hypothetical protein
MKRTKEIFTEQRIYETLLDEIYPATETEKEFFNNQNYKLNKIIIMSINATNEGKKRELIPTGNYAARCYKMIQIGTVEEIVQGKHVIQPKVRIGWELPTEKKVFNEANGEQPYVIEKEYTLSLYETSNLRKDLKSWRGKDFTEEQAKCFDITVLIGVPCFLNIIHNPSKKSPSVFYEAIAGITPIPKGFEIPKQINPTFELSYDKWNEEKFDSLPDFVKDKMMTSEEYKKMKHPEAKDLTDNSNQELSIPESNDDLPF